MLPEIEQLIEVSRRYGSDPSLVIAGGGNTSFKTADRLWVKASGHALGTIDEGGFAVLDRGLLAGMATKQYPSDTALREDSVKRDLAAACITRDLRPSVETFLHNCLEAAFVVHTHPTLVNALMCSQEAEELCAELFPEALYIPYTDPGYTLFRRVSDSVAQYKSRKGVQPQVIFLQNHGIFVGADTVEGIDALYSSVLSVLSARVPALPVGGLQAGAPEMFLAQLDAALRRFDGRPRVTRVTADALTGWALEHPEAVSAPFTPDGIVYCKSDIVCLEDSAGVGEAVAEYAASHGYAPRVILAPGVGLVAVGDSDREAAIITDVFTDVIKVAYYAAAFGGPHPMEAPWIAFINGWEAENYRSKFSK